MPIVSVLIATYNRAEWLAQAIGSVRAQTFTDWELIIVNDGSTDGTRAWLDRLASEDARVRPIHQDNRGLAAARNAGIRVATGTYLAIIDDDDAWMPEKLEKQIHERRSLQNQLREVIKSLKLLAKVKPKNA